MSVGFGSDTHGSSLSFGTTRRHADIRRLPRSPCPNLLLRSSNRPGQSHECAANQHHGGFIPEPGSRPRNGGNGNRRGHRGTSCIGLTGSDCRRCRNQPENRQRQEPPTHKVEPRSPLVDGTPRPSTFAKLQSMCHGGHCRTLDKTQRLSDVAQYRLRSWQSVTQISRTRISIIRLRYNS